MTFACSRRSFAATALVAGLVLPVAASAAGPGPGGGHHTPTPGGSQRPTISRHQVSGILKEMTSTSGPNGPTVPAALTVQAGSTEIIVTVPVTATVLRGYGGRSSLDEFAKGDRISAQGSFQTSSTFTARWIKDWSIQRAYSRVVGSVASVQGLPSSFTLQVARSGSQRSQLVTVTLTSTVIMSGTVTVQPGALQPGTRVLAMGLYYRTQSTLHASRVRVLSARSARSAHRRQRP